MSTLLGNDENSIVQLRRNLKKLLLICKRQVEQNHMTQQSIPDIIDFWILGFFIKTSNESTISSKMSITLLVEFLWLNHQVALAFRIFSVFRFPCTCWISSKTDLSLMENLNFFHSCSKRESSSSKTSCFHVRWTNARAKWWLLKLIYFGNGPSKCTYLWRPPMPLDIVLVPSKALKKMFLMFKLQSLNTLTIALYRALALFELPSRTRLKNLLHRVFVMGVFLGDTWGHSLQDVQQQSSPVLHSCFWQASVFVS